LPADHAFAIKCGGVALQNDTHMCHMNCQAHKQVTHARLSKAQRGMCVSNAQASLKDEPQ